MSEDDKPRGEPRPKVTVKAVKTKSPVQNTRNTEFTPHGIRGGGTGRGPRPSGKTAAQARRQRWLTISGSVVAVLAIAWGVTYFQGHNFLPEATPGWLSRPGPKINVAGSFGQAPKVSIPKDLLPSGKLQVNPAIKGNGRKLANGDTVFLHYTFYSWSKSTNEDKPNESTSKEVASTWKPRPAQQPGQPPAPAGPEQFVVGTIGALKGLDKALPGQTAGSRLVIEIPPSQGLGQGGSQMGVDKNASLVFVADVLAAYPKNAQAQGTPKQAADKALPTVGAIEAGQGPKVTIPKSDPPKDLRAEVLIEGNGPVTTKNDTALVKYRGVIWRNGQTFDSSYRQGQLAGFPLGTTQGMPGFFKSLQGKKIGSRVLLVIPPKDGYGKEGNPQAGIKGTDTTVFVVDLIGLQPK
jgi:FKBP-type peptidyl-prolyl cis-trans isomerase